MPFVRFFGESTAWQFAFEIIWPLETSEYSRKIHSWNGGTYDTTPWGLTLNVGDYYTRDRSTPRRDEFYGGNDDLTAAVGWEENGVTTIMFR